MFCDWEPAIIHTLFSSCHGCQVCLYNKYSEVLSFIGTVACKRVKVPVEFWNKALQNALPASPHTRIKKSNLLGHSHRVNCSALWVPRPPSLNDNTSSVAVTIALLSESEVAEAPTLGSWKLLKVQECALQGRNHAEELWGEKKKPLCSPSAGAAFEDLIVGAASGRHGGLCWHVSASLLVRGLSTTTAKWVKGACLWVDVFC